MSIKNNDQVVGYPLDIIPTSMYRSKPIKRDQKIPTFRRQPAHTHPKSVAFSGRGCVPDLMSDTDHPTMLSNASATVLEHGVPGVEGMMPPAGVLPKLQSGQKQDGGSGGAGSFATRVAFGAMG